MYLSNTRAGKQPHTWSRLVSLPPTQTIHFVPNSSSVVRALLMRIFDIQLQQGAWFLHFLPCVDKLYSFRFHLCPCGSDHSHIGRSLRRERKGAGEERSGGNNLTKYSCGDSSRVDGLWPCPVPRHLIKKVVQSCFAGIPELMPAFT